MAARILMVAGEASADAHGARVLDDLAATAPGLTAFGVGGAALAAAGLDRVAPAEIFANAGITEVLASVPRLYGVLRRLTTRARAERPDVAVLMDLPDFNMPLAARLHRLGVPVIYYIGPQMWAWRPGRVHAVRATVARMLVILPFEVPFYAKHGVPARFVGHPLVEQLAGSPNAGAARRRLGLPPLGEGPPQVAMLPGSRRKEVQRHLPTMLAALALLRRRGIAVRALLPVASTISRGMVEALVRASPVAESVTVIGGATAAATSHHGVGPVAAPRAGASPVTAQARDRGASPAEGQGGGPPADSATLALSACDAAMVCSGTATLQAALLGCPLVVVYRVSWLTYRILRRLVTVPYVSLVNLIAGGPLVRELLQDDLTPAALADEVARLLAASETIPGPDGPVRRHPLADRLRALGAGLGRGGTAQAVADAVRPYLTTDRAAA